MSLIQLLKEKQPIIPISELLSLFEIANTTSEHIPHILESKETLELQKREVIVKGEPTSWNWYGNREGKGIFAYSETEQTLVIAQKPIITAMREASKEGENDKWYINSMMLGIGAIKPNVQGVEVVEIFDFTRKNVDDKVYELSEEFTSANGELMRELIKEKETIQLSDESEREASYIFWGLREDCPPIYKLYKGDEYSSFDFLESNFTNIIDFTLNEEEHLKKIWDTELATYSEDYYAVRRYHVNCLIRELYLEKIEEYEKDLNHCIHREIFRLKKAGMLVEAHKRTNSHMDAKNHYNELILKDGKKKKGYITGGWPWSFEHAPNDATNCIKYTSVEKIIADKKVVFDRNKFEQAFKRKLNGEVQDEVTLLMSQRTQGTRHISEREQLDIFSLVYKTEPKKEQESIVITTTNTTMPQGQLAFNFF